MSCGTRGEGDFFYAGQPGGRGSGTGSAGCGGGTPDWESLMEPSEPGTDGGWQGADELARTSAVLEEITGERVRYFRPPFGARRPVVFRIARELGLTPVLWNAMTSDWSEPSADKIAGALMGKIDGLKKRGLAANVVLHDGGHLMQGADRGPSVKAAGMVVARYEKAARFVRPDAWGGEN